MKVIIKLMGHYISGRTEVIGYYDTIDEVIEQIEHIKDVSAMPPDEWEIRHIIVED